jgi:hypothetical protein
MQAQSSLFALFGGIFWLKDESLEDSVNQKSAIRVRRTEGRGPPSCARPIETPVVAHTHSLLPSQLRQSVYKKAWAHDIRDNYGNMEDFRTWVKNWNIQPD